MSEFTREMVSAAYAFESAAIDAGFDMAKVKYQSKAWGGTHKLEITGIDDHNVRREYVEGGSNNGC